MAVQQIPQGYHSLTPSVVVDNAAKAIDFYQKAFDAKEIYRLPMGDRIAHAELQIGDSRFMLSDEFKDWDALSPKTRGGPTGGMLIYVPDADAAIDKAVKAGAKVVQPAKTSSGATAWGPSSIRSATSGCSARTSRTYRPTRWRSAASSGSRTCRRTRRARIEPGHDFRPMPEVTRAG